MENDIGRVLFFSRGRGRGHAIPDITIGRHLAGLDLNYVSYGTGAATLRSAACQVIDLNLPDDASYLDLLPLAHAVIARSGARLVLAHEEFAVPVAAHMLGVPSIFITDFFPRQETIAGESLSKVDAVVYIDFPGTFPIPSNLKKPPRFAGPVIRGMKFDRRDRNAARSRLKIGLDSFVVSVIPGSWATESRAPVMELVVKAFDGISITSKALIWLTQRDVDAARRYLEPSRNLMILSECECVEEVIVASDVVVTKGNRGTVIEAASLGLPTVSLSRNINPVDDAIVARIPTNTTVHPDGLDPSQLALVFRRAASRDATMTEYYGLHADQGHSAAVVVAEEIVKVMNGGI